MSGRPKPTKAPAKAPAKAPTKGATGVKGKPAAKTQPAAKKGGKNEASAGGSSKEVKEQPAASKQEEEPKQAATAKSVTVKELKTVIAEDTDKKIRTLGKPVLLVDNESGSARTFFTYSSLSTCVDITNPTKMKPDQIRMGVLSSLRAGKIYVVNMEAVAQGMFDELKKLFDQVAEGFFDSCMDRSIIQPQKYEPLIQESDGDAFNKFYFMEDELTKFFFVILSTNRNHDEAFKAKFNLFIVDEV